MKRLISLATILLLVSLGHAIAAPVDAVNVLTFGAKCDGVTDDRAAIQKAISASTAVRLPVGTCVIGAALTFTADYKRLVGAGMGVSIIKNTGTGNAIEFKSAGGVDSTKLYCGASDFTIQGNASSLSGLYLYDVARCAFENIESKSNGADGVRVDMGVSNRFSNVHGTGNTGYGVRVQAALKATVEFQSTQNTFTGSETISNTAGGVYILRSAGNVFSKGDSSVNADGFVLEGSARNVISDYWIENNTTDALRIITSASPTALNSDRNRFIANLATGTGNVTINNGNANYLAGNYIAANLVIANGAATPQTYVGQQAAILGSVTDGGNNTINLHAGATPNFYYRQSGVKRYETTVGSTVDITSDIQAIRLSAIKGLSSTTTAANNVTGFVDIADAATNAAVTFGTSESSSAYNVVLGTWDVTGVPAANSHIAYITARATTGFTINLVAAPGVGTTVRVFWVLVR